MNKICFSVVCVSVLLLSGCATYDYVGEPEFYEVTDEQVPSLEVDEKISFINGHSVNDERIFLEISGAKHRADFHQFTESIVNLAEKSLSERGMGQQLGDKSLKLTITQIERIPAMWVYRIVIHVEVEDHLGKKYQIKGDNTSGGNLRRTVNGALYRVVTTLLNDEEIREYLQ